MKTKETLEQMEDYELINEVLKLQKALSDLAIIESKASYIHNYHFTSMEVLKLTKDRYMGSAMILCIYDLKGKPLFNPTTISNGFSNTTINGLLDDLSETFNHKIELAPTDKRLN